MIAGTGKARAIIRVSLLVVLDVVATAIAYISAAWGTGVFGEVLRLGDFSQIIAAIAVTSGLVFAFGYLYAILWEYASVDIVVQKSVVRFVDEFGCAHFERFSTDKAVNPVNVIGATKRKDETIVRHYMSVSKAVFACVRFGNMLGGHGSVISLFKRQVPLRIIKMPLHFSAKNQAAFMHPTNEERIGSTAFSQFKSLFSRGLRNLKTDSRCFPAASAQTCQFFTKPIFEATSESANACLNLFFEARAA